MEGVATNREGATKRVTKMLTHAIAVLVMGNGMVIPISHEFWLPEEALGDQHRTCSDIARAIIDQLNEHKIYCRVLLDGAYANPVMFDFLNSRGLQFAMRTHKNRLVGDELIRIDQHPDLQLKDGEESKKALLNYKNHSTKFWIVSHKRKKKNGEYETVYYVANYAKDASLLVKDYETRWEVEKCIRTCKQYLGLSDCQSTQLSVQRAHAHLVLLAYALLQINVKLRLKSCPEDIINEIRYPLNSQKTKLKTSTILFGYA